MSIVCLDEVVYYLSYSYWIKYNLYSCFYWLDADAKSSSKPEHSPHWSWGPPQGFPINAGVGPDFAPNPQYVQPPHQYDNYSPAPPLDN